MTRGEDLQVDITSSGEDLVVTLLAESLMHAEAPHLAGRLVERILAADEGSDRVILDFGRVVHMNSNAVSVLLLTKAGIERSGKALALKAVSPAIRELLRFMCLDKVLTIIDQ